METGTHKSNLHTYNALVHLGNKTLQKKETKKRISSLLTTESLPKSIGVSDGFTSY